MATGPPCCRGREGWKREVRLHPRGVGSCGLLGAMLELRNLLVTRVPRRSAGAFASGCHEYILALFVCSEGFLLSKVLSYSSETTQFALFFWGGGV